MNSDRIEVRKAQIAAALREEGASEQTVSALATDETAARMVSYEDKCVAQILSMFGGKS